MTATSSLVIMLLVNAFLALYFLAIPTNGTPIHASQLDNKQQDLAVKSSSEKQQAYHAEDAQQVTELSTSTDDEEQLTAKSKAIANLQKQQRLANPVAAAEKLRRGLSNFMNHLNPGHYFVPALTPQQQQASRDKSNLSHTKNPAQTSSQSSSSSEFAAIVNGDSTPDALIKGRLALMRPIGGPMRWGRR